MFVNGGTWRRSLGRKKPVEPAKCCWNAGFMRLTGSESDWRCTTNASVVVGWRFYSKLGFWIRFQFNHGWWSIFKWFLIVSRKTCSLGLLDTFELQSTSIINRYYFSTLKVRVYLASNQPSANPRHLPTNPTTLPGLIDQDKAERRRREIKYKDSLSGTILTKLDSSFYRCHITFTFS